MVHFVGAGSGAVDLITVRGAKLLGQADVVIYAGSLVNPDLLNYCKEGCEIHNSAKMTLEQVIAVIQNAENAGKTTVRKQKGPFHVISLLTVRIIKAHGDPATRFSHDLWYLLYLHSQGSASVEAKFLMERSAGNHKVSTKQTMISK